MDEGKNCTAPEASEYQKTFDILTRKLASLAESIDNISHKITPVLSPVPPAAPNCSPANSFSGSPAVVDMKNRINDIDLMLIRLADISDRIEL